MYRKSSKRDRDVKDKMDLRFAIEGRIRVFLIHEKICRAFMFPVHCVRLSSTIGQEGVKSIGWSGNPAFEGTQPIDQFVFKDEDGTIQPVKLTFRGVKESRMTDKKRVNLRTG